MRVISDIQKMQMWARSAQRKGKDVGFVPTMGYLHEGHLSLMRRARKENSRLVISIFVNPTQFGPREDFKRYPRNLSRDKELAQNCGVDVIFYPKAKDMYPQDFQSYVQVQKLSRLLCGISRPGHFRGVTTVVLKLFNIVQPAVAYFGQKDAQQAIIIECMVRELNLPVKIKTLPIVREKDGLAMSSRNAYLTKAKREEAKILYKSLQTAVAMIKSGCRNPRQIIAKMRRMIKTQPDARIDYIKIVNLSELKEVKIIKGKLLIAAAVFIGKTRLIDNVIITTRRG